MSSTGHNLGGAVEDDKVVLAAAAAADAVQAADRIAMVVDQSVSCP